MRKLPLISGFILLVCYVYAQQNPHGETLPFSCLDCHTTEGWSFSAATAEFSHDSTNYRLEGQHVYADCKACHTSLVFSEAKTNCMDCHLDMHNNTVGQDCAECHTQNSWIVSNTTELHQNVGFPLLGAHTYADCASCHTSVSLLEFPPLGVDCIDCHRDDYQSSTNPNHVEAGLSTNCIECHKVESFEWTSSGFNHDFFPLTKGHQINDCAACHSSGLFEPISNECISCHQQDFNAASNPSHQGSGFSTNCMECHTTDPGWTPAEFQTHDAVYFPVYSGEHRGEWENCTDCHIQPGNYSLFSCIDCHEHNKSDMDEEHGGINGYSFNSMACFACHPSGREEESFNHNATGFPLKGAHIQTNCTDCHSQSYAGTSAACSSCHTNNYNQAQDPGHTLAGISTECEICHTEDGWSPSQFDHNSTSGFELADGHAIRQCSECHQGSTNSASPECISCHQENYNGAANHVASNYPTDCFQCHSISNWEDADFDHNATNFPLTGAHGATECSACHTDGYAGTAIICSSCHLPDYNETGNPNHTSLGISVSCEECHTTNIGWEPAMFPNHQVFYALNGAHAAIAGSCVLCHGGNYQNTPNNCFGCHATDYNSTSDPVHTAAQFPTDCETCHSETAWTPSTFQHDAFYFPIYSGEHHGEWDLCTDCHTQPSNYSIFSCTTCHEHNQNEMDGKHSEVNSYLYTSINCLTCHPNGTEDD